MQKVAALSLLVASVATVSADQFIGDIFKVDGNKVLVSRSVVGLDKKLKSKLVTLTVAETCTITRSDPPNKKKPVEDGLKSDIFKASPIKAGITTDGDKITAINVLSFRPVKVSKGKNKDDLFGTITRIEGNKITVKLPQSLGEAQVLNLADPVKVVYGVRQGQNFEAGEPIDDGLKNPLFASGKARAMLITDKKKMITEIRLLPSPLVPGSDPDEPKVALERVVEFGNPAGVRCAAFSPDGKHIIAGEMGYGLRLDNRILRLWETESGREVLSADLTIKNFLNTDIINVVAFSPDGSAILAGGEGGHVHLLSARTGKRIAYRFLGQLKDNLGDNAILAAVFAPDGTILAATLSGKLAQLDPDSTGVAMSRFSDRGGNWCLAFSPDCKQLVFGDGEKVVRLQNLAEPRQVRTLLPEGGLMRSIAFAPDGKHILAADDDNNVRVWIAASGELKCRLKGIRAVFTKDSKHVASAGPDHIVRLWDIDGGKEIRSFEGHTATVRSLTVSPDGKQLLTASEDETIRLWDLDSGKEVRSFRRQVTPVFGIAVPADGQRLLAGDSYGVARVWDMTAGRQLCVFREHARAAVAAKTTSLPLRSVALSADGKQALTANDSHAARLWDSTTGKELVRFEQPKDRILRAYFLADGKQVGTPGWETFNMQVWDAATGKPLRLLPLPGGFSYSRTLALAPDGKRLLLPTTHGTNVLHDLDDVKLKSFRKLEAHDKPVNAAVFSTDGKYAVTVGEDGTSWLWDMPAGKAIRKFTAPKGQLTSAALSRDGKQALATSWFHTAWLFDTDTGKELHQLVGHHGGVFAGAFFPGKDRAVTGGEDGSLRLWDTKTGAELCQLYSFVDGSWAVIDSHGRFDGPDNGKVPWIYYRAGSDIVPLAQLHSRYHDPGLLAKHLGHDKAPLREVKHWKDLAVFPAVRATPLKTGDTKLSIHLSNRGGGIGKVQVFVNGKEHTGDARPAKFNTAAARAMLTVDLAALRRDGVNQIRIVAWNTDGTLSSAGLQLRW